MSQQNEEQTRLIALAHLKNGKKPQDVADITGMYSHSLYLFHMPVPNQNK